MWERKLRENLTFPFIAKVIESDRKFPYRIGEELTVLNISYCDDLYGILLSCRIGRKKYSIPLCNIAPQDTGSMNYWLTTQRTRITAFLLSGPLISMLDV